MAYQKWKKKSAILGKNRSFFHSIFDYRDWFSDIMVYRIMMNILAQCYYSLEKSRCTKITFSIFVQIFSLYLLFEKKLIDHFRSHIDLYVDHCDYLIYLQLYLHLGSCITICDILNLSFLY